METRPAQEEDLGQITFIENAIEGLDAASRQTLNSRLLMFNAGFLVAKINSKVVGYIETCIWRKETPEFQANPNFFLTEHTINGPILYIIFVGVEELQRRHGVGSHLVREICKVGQKFSVSSIQAVSRDPIMPFYKSMGFSALKQLPDFLPDGQNYTLMEFGIGASRLGRE